MAAEALSRGIDVGRRGESLRIALEHAGRRHTWNRGNTSLNSVMSRRVTTDKSVTTRYLTGRGFRTPDNAVFRADEAERAWAWGSSLGRLVVKPLDGIQGRHVHVDLQDYSEFLSAFDDVAQGSHRVIVEEYCQGRERRFLVVDNVCLAMMNRRPASVLGDGWRSVRELVEDKNRDRGLIHQPLVIDEAAMQVLHNGGLTPDSVPGAGQRAFLRRIVNVHAGADAVDETDLMTEEHRGVVEAAAQSIPGLRLAGFDVLLPEDHGEAPVVLEINANPMIALHHFPWEGQIRDVAGAIIDAMFPDTAR